MAVAPTDPLIRRVLDLNVPVAVRLAQGSESLGHILGWTVGSIIKFDKPADAELDLIVNNVRVGWGHAVKVGENFGLRVRSIQSRRQRVDALALRRGSVARPD